MLPNVTYAAICRLRTAFGFFTSPSRPTYTSCPLPARSRSLAIIGRTSAVSRFTSSLTALVFHGPVGSAWHVVQRHADCAELFANRVAARVVLCRTGGGTLRD